MSSNEETVIRVGGVPEHFNFPWHLAIESGASRKLGLALDWRDYPAGTGAMLAALSSGELDLAILLTEGVAYGLAQELPIVPLSLYTDSPLIWGVHVAPASHFDQLASLRSARFAISRQGSGSHLMSLALAIDQGWPANSLDLVVVGDLAGAIQAFGADQADVFLWEHFTTEPAVEAGHFRRIGDFVSPWPAWTVCASVECAEQQSTRLMSLFELVADTAAALAQASDAPARIAARFGLRESAVALWLEGTHWVARPQSPHSALAAASSMLRAAGAIGA